MRLPADFEPKLKTSFACWLQEQAGFGVGSEAFAEAEAMRDRLWPMIGPLMLALLADAKKRAA